jgi:hypothetical protein
MKISLLNESFSLIKLSAYLHLDQKTALDVAITVFVGSASSKGTRDEKGKRPKKPKTKRQIEWFIFDW